MGFQEVFLFVIKAMAQARPEMVAADDHTPIPHPDDCSGFCFIPSMLAQTKPERLPQTRIDRSIRRPDLTQLPVSHKSRSCRGTKGSSPSGVGNPAPMVAAVRVEVFDSLQAPVSDAVGLALIFVEHSF